MKKIFSIVLLFLFSVTSLANSGIHEKSQYSEMETILIDIFTPYAKAKGLNRITINIDEDNTRYTGGVYVENQEIKIVFGSEFDLAYPQLPEDAYAKILCHELGHIFGETADADQPEKHVISPEAESDYFAGAVCLQKLFKAYPAKTLIIADPIVTMNCKTQYAAHSDQKRCERIAIAGAALFTALHESLSKAVPGLKADPFYAIPNFNKKETRFFDFYPSLQCRAETILAGALCTTSEEQWSTGDKNWQCSSGSGARPSCWYR